MMIGPEVLGIGYNLFQNYAQDYNHDLLDAYAFHLYHGESDNVSDNHDPDLFNPNLRAIKNSYPGKPIFQTEYDRGGWFNTVHLMHNALTQGNVSAYLYWGLAWIYPSVGLVQMENPWTQGSWETNDGYVLSKVYWAFRQYSKYIGSGWKRVAATNGSDNLRVSAYLNPEKNMLTLVVVNIGSEAESSNFNLQGFNTDPGIVTRTSQDEDGVEISSNHDITAELEYPAQSITTLSFTGEVVSSIETDQNNAINFQLNQNYPNPFNPETVIRYSVGAHRNAPVHVELSIYNNIGQKVTTLVSESQQPGEHLIIWDAENMALGVYYYRIVAGDETKVKKMMFLR